jgi:nucleoside-diphosphate-sugar epimerase
LTAALFERGYAVRALVRGDTTSILAPNVEVHKIADLTGVDWPAALHGADAVLHLAAIAHRGTPRTAAEARQVRNVNVSAIAKLTAAAVTAGVRRLVVLSSIGVLGCDSGSGAFSSSSPVAPYDFYSQTKLDGERAAADGVANSALELCIVRAPLVFGPNAPGNFGRMIRSLATGIPLPLGAIHNQRSLISVWNLCDFLTTCVSSPGALGEPLLVADEETISTSELLRLCAQLMGRPRLLLPVPVTLLRLAGAVFRRRRDIDRLCASLVVDTRDTAIRTGWRAPMRLTEGLRQALRQPGHRYKTRFASF